MRHPYIHCHPDGVPMQFVNAIPVSFQPILQAARDRGSIERACQLDNGSERSLQDGLLSRQHNWA